MNMRKLMILLLSAFVLHSCNNDVDEADWTVDSLVITSADSQLQDAGDGNLKMTLPTEFSGTLKLNVESNSPWAAEVGDITIQDEQWITLSPAEGEGNGTIDINIAPNHSAADRIGSVVVTTSGNIPVKKTITLIQGNTDDMLSIGFDGVELPEGVTVAEGISGAWSMVLPIDFETQGVSVAISSTSYPSVSVTYPEGLPQDWLSTTPPVQTKAGETQTVTFYVSENISNEYREALVTFTSVSGEVEVEKTLTVSQLGDEDIVWCGDYFQGTNEDLDNAEIILPANTLQGVKIAELKNITANNIELPEQDGSGWFTVSIENSDVLITTTKENTTTNKENVEELVLKSKLSGEEFKITLRQCMSGYGTILNKKLWNVIATGSDKSDFTKLYDNKWCTENDKNLYIQLSQYNNAESLEIIIDLGAEHSAYNAVGLMPRLQWTALSPKKISVATSSDNDIWSSIITESEYYVESDLNYESEYNSSSSNKYDAHYEGIIKWAKLGEQTDRYVKISMKYGFDNVFYNSNAFCFDEIFVTKLSE